MSSIEGLKEQARRHEQKEEWQKALDLYLKAIEKLDEEEQPDIGLYNRVGDLFTRTNDRERAAEHYDRAIDLYLESELPNNAIAVCKKILRNLPERHATFLRMGQIRAEQGFLVDARQNFLTYAERVQGDGDLDEAMRALVEFADLAPDDTDIRMAIAMQFVQHERAEEALEQLATGYRVLNLRGDSEGAQLFENQIREIDPEAFERIMSAPAPAAVDDAFMDFGEVTFDRGVSGGAESDSDDGDDDGVDLGGFDIALGGDDSDDSGSVDIPAAAPVETPTAALPDDEDAVGDFSGFEIGIDSSDDSDAGDAVAEVAADPEKDAAAAELEAMAASFGSTPSALDDDEDIGGDLPLMSLDDEPEDDTSDLPFVSMDDDDADADDEDIGGDLPIMSLDTEEDDGGLPDFDDSMALPGLDDEPMATEPEAAPAGGSEFFDSSPAAAPAADAADDWGTPTPAPAAPTAPAADDPRTRHAALVAQAEASPNDVALRQRVVELAYQLNDDAVMADAFLGLARALQAGGNAAKAQAVFQQVLSVDPDNAEARAGLGESGPATRPVAEVSASEDYVDLGSLILGDDEEKTTRFVVAYEEPSGDEDADFAKMLSQFKAKVAGNFDAGDVKAHHDLGTAYKEMGLLDEAVEEFQQALRASPDHLPTFELLGQTFMDKGEFDAAVRVMTRALESPWEVEDELLGIYYYLGRAHEALGQVDKATDFYDQVFSLDINFADVTERLRKLR